MDKTYIIAEIGNNHNGSIDKAKRLIDVASKAGVNAVKFQSFEGLDIVSPKVLANEYPGWKVTKFKYWYEFLDTIALPLEHHQEIINYTQKCNLDFITTPVSPRIVKILETMNGITAYKLASMDLTNIGLIKAMAATRKPIIMSTGMGELSEVEKAVQLFGEEGLSILHCVSDYPLNPKNAALKNINELKIRFPKAKIGFSDHSLGHELVLTSLALGAKIIEKHITLDRRDPLLAEHHFSLEPTELELMVKWIRDIDENLSVRGWTRSHDEKDSKLKFRRSFHYKSDLTLGHVVTQDDLVFIRPADGVGYEKISKIIGKKLMANKNAYSPCLENDVGEKND